MDGLAERALRILASPNVGESTGLRKSDTPRLREMRGLAMAAGLAAFAIVVPAPAAAHRLHGHAYRHVRARDASRPDGATAQMLEAPSAEEVARRSGVVRAARAAAVATGCDPGFLAALAWEESRLGRVDRNRRSSASGPFQFTAEAWLAAVRDHGARHGLAREAAAIARGRSGELYVSAKAGRHAAVRLMAMREDPRVAALMAAESVMASAPALAEAKGRPVDWADLYLAHVLGKSGAVAYIEAMRRHPAMPAVLAAGPGGRPNKGLFVTADGRNLDARAAHDAIRDTLVRRSAEIEIMSVARAGAVEVAEAPADPPRPRPRIVAHADHHGRRMS